MLSIYRSGVATLGITIASALLGCSTPTIKSPESSTALGGSPLGPSYVLLPAPSDDDSLLGRMFTEKPEPGRSFEETSKPNPCANTLSEARDAAQSASFEDAQEITAGVSASALLGTFGFAGDPTRASHFLYRLETTRRLSRSDTTEYEKCCRENGCGYGYVSALVYG